MKKNAKMFSQITLSLALAVASFVGCGPAKLVSSQGESQTSNAFSPDPSAPAPVQPTPTPTPTPSPTPTAASTPTSVIGKPIQIQTRINYSSSVDLESTNVSTVAHLWASAPGSPNQLFEFTSAGEFKVHGLCLAPKTVEVGGSLQTEVCTGSQTQAWKYNLTTGEIKHSSGYCMDLISGSLANGAVINLWSCSGNSSQSWELTLQ